MAADAPVDAAEFTSRSAQYLAHSMPARDEASMEAGLVLIRAANALVQESERTVHRPLGLRWTGFSAVFALSLFRALEARSLARLAGVSRQAMSIVISTLERNGLIDRTRGTDKRLLVVELTESGEQVAEDALRGQVELSERWFASLTAAEREQLVSLLTRILVANGRR